MPTEDKLKKIFAEALGIPHGIVDDNLKYAELAEWDSVAHMTLIAAIEEAFDIMMDAEDVIEMSSFVRAKQIVAKYHQ
ncbi:acyl carrier protein [Serpentinimonas raichei]|uniref:Acyl carrier protein n=1 Tax=Serpentinimonas raichei TaxID=1458425 RepID=A0A060NP17_9BURK|nr:acyl carrier protein [Serpentinimonas raichei]BAO80669.1 acyl carrier protein [Serpentinimonas raichei]